MRRRMRPALLPRPPDVNGADVDDGLEDICRKNGLDWGALNPRMRASGRCQVETH